ncbi:MAG TPA: peptidyl-prolyl cis-trans isomerase [Candidatus Deferrimicrobiaceae bacterium]
MILFGICAVFAAACGTPTGKGQGRVYAVVNGEPITEATLQKEVEGLPPYVRPILETPAGRAQFLESVITRDLLLREALRRGIGQRPEVADRVSMARKSILLEALLRDVADKAPGMGDEALRNTYNENAEQFQVGDRAKVSHMLFRDKARAEEMYRRAMAGEPFEALMKELGTRDGEVAADLGDIERGNFVKEFEAASFAAAPGSVVGPVRTTYGWHVIKVYERKPAGVRSFEEVKPQLLAEQRERAQRDAFEALIADLRKSSNVRVLVKVEEGMAKPVPAPGAPPEAPKPKAGQKPAPAGK